jgi:uncharacterized membrane protein
MSEQPPSGHGVAGLLDRVLRFIDKPWKAVVVVVLIVILGCGWVLYEKRNELFEAWLTPDTPELRTSEVPDALTKLTTETNADLVQIWAVDLSSNSQWFLGARRHDGERPVIPSPRRLPIIDHTSDVSKLVEVLEGHPTCVDLSPAGTPVARRLAERGMKRGCAVPIPPNPESFVGVIYLAWPDATDASNENVAIGAAREVARKLATH